jgi:hypothetical protein
MAVARGDEVTAEEVHFPGDRQHVRQFATISLLALLRKVLLSGD